VLHSHLSDAERHQHWQQIASGRVQVVVERGAPLFAPTPHLGMIVIDEEHETSFKQDTTPRYHTREVARRRAELDARPADSGFGDAGRSNRGAARKEGAPTNCCDCPRASKGLPMPPVVIVDVRHDPMRRRGMAIGPGAADGDAERPRSGRTGDFVSESARVFAGPLVPARAERR